MKDSLNIDAPMDDYGNDYRGYMSTMAWPFPIGAPPVQDRGTKTPVFNPDNFEDAPF